MKLRNTFSRNALKLKVGVLNAKKKKKKKKKKEEKFHAYNRF